MQLTISERTWLEVGDRVIVFPGLPSQWCGTVVGFRPVFGHEGAFPVVLRDAGWCEVVSYEWGLRKLADVEQLQLF